MSTFDPQKLVTIAENEQKVYEAGKQAEYDRFWDIYQDKGGRSNYTCAFAHTGWTDETFKAKYDMVLSYWGGSQMFHQSLITDLKGTLESLGITLDTKDCHAFGQMFQLISSETIPVIDLTNADQSTNYMFASPSIKYIEKIISSENTKYNAYAFQNATALIDVVFEGVIARAVDIHWSPLSKASIVSIINALSTTTSGLTLTLSKSAVNTAFGINVDDATTYPEGSEYYILRHSKDNWTISYM